jgi:hypothetical protein
MSSTRIVRRSWRKEGNKPVEMRAFMHDLRAASCELGAGQNARIPFARIPPTNSPIRQSHTPIPTHTYPYHPYLPRYLPHTYPRPPRALARRYYTAPDTCPYLPHTCLGHGRRAPERGDTIPPPIPTCPIPTHTCLAQGRRAPERGDTIPPRYPYLPIPASAKAAARPSAAILYPPIPTHTYPYLPRPRPPRVLARRYYTHPYLPRPRPPRALARRYYTPDTYPIPTHT